MILEAPMTFDRLFEEGRIGSARIRNRFAVPAMVLNYCTEDGYPTERYIAYHEAKSKGGWGLIITQDYAIEPRGKGYSHIPGLWEDEQVVPHAELPKRVHKHGASIFAQIYHAGRQSNDSIMGMQPVAPSPIPCPTKKQMPHPLSVEEVEELVSKFGDCARRARDAGFDGVEVHGAHGYLIAQFMSAYSNKRTDRYGGTVTNRARFALEIVEDIRRKAGEDFPIIFRISGDEFVAGGRGIEETKAICMLLEDAGVDAIHVSAGVYGSRHRIVPPARMPHAHIVDHAWDVKRVVSVPVITVGWINDPIVAEGIIKSGKADFVAMGRASLADPELPNKTKAGALEDIIYCIGCMQGCAEKIRKAGAAGGCMINPMTGHEFEYRIEKTDRPKKVFVAGGGIAGAEAAIIAARRGHSVELFEASDRLGGEYSLAAVAPGKGEIASFLIWQERQLRSLGVKIHLGRALTADAVDADRPDALIVATGSHPTAPSIPGGTGPRVVHAYDVLSGEADVGDSAVVIGGGMVGSETANHLAAHEKKVSIVEMLDDIATDEETNSRYLLLEDLKHFGVEVYTGSRVLGIDDGVVTIEKQGTQVTVGPADTIVLALGAVPENQLYEALKNKVPAIHLVGDAKGVRKALEAIEEGFLAGLTV
jgi:2,4-dienoyl-CoA reductase-like NADH-dependent reductase (Old Yellow Enzyme family)/thioredoxin reductase